MRIRVLLFGVLKDILSRESDTLELPPDARVSQLLDHYRALHGKAATDGVWSSLAVAVNRQYATAAHALAEGDEVALLPPVSGGAVPVTEGELAIHAELVRQPIDAAAILASLKQGEDGAVVLFDGIVRNHTRGRRTLYLVYEAYEEMALAQMRDLAARAITERGVREVAIVHRLGRLEVGETSILIAVASAHRAQAFEACRWMIDTLKKTVPIWKKEYFVDGAVWSAGEPFPAEIAAGGDAAS